MAHKTIVQVDLFIDQALRIVQTLGLSADDAEVLAEKMKKAGDKKLTAAMAARSINIRNDIAVLKEAIAASNNPPCRVPVKEAARG